MTARRVDLPEIGPYLGRLADVTRSFEHPDVDLDRVRLDLVSELFEQAAIARGFLLTGDTGGARAALDRAVWSKLWREAADRATERTVAAVTGRLERAAASVRYPRRLLAASLPSAEDRAMLAARIDAAGIPLEERVARGFPTGVGWWEAVRQTTTALEDSWEALEEIVRDELRRTEPAVSAIGAWRPSLIPWFVALGLAALATGWVGLVLGGYLPTPVWLRGFHDWFWSIPWP
ncbi:MAG: hypothetical protein AB7S39_11550 [Gemmatimonadales bacterium]